MSRIGKLPVEIPGGVEVNLDGVTLNVKGPKGELTRELSDVVNIDINEKEIVITRRDDSRESRSHHGMVRSLVANMVEGVTNGYKRTLEINGVGYRAELLKNSYVRFDLGYSHPIFVELPESVTAEVDKGQTKLTLESIDKELIGQVAAKIRGLRPPEPYKGKGIKYSDEVLLRKVGKAGK